MALAHLKFRLVVELGETSGKSTKKAFDLTAADYAAAVTASGTIMSRVVAASDLKVKSYSINDVFTDVDYTNPSTQVEKENQAIISVQLADRPGNNATLVIPGAKIGCFQTSTGPGKDIVDAAASIVTDFVAIYGADGLALTSDGEAVDSGQGIEGKRRHVKNRSS